ncbi:MAG: hypothetical protein ACE3JP_04440 [Ectobacillus sp.]
MAIAVYNKRASKTGCPESRIFDFWMPFFTFQNLDISTFLIISLIRGFQPFGQPFLDITSTLKKLWITFSFSYVPIFLHGCLLKANIDFGPQFKRWPKIHRLV